MQFFDRNLNINFIFNIHRSHGLNVMRKIYTCRNHKDKQTIKIFIQ